MSEQGNTSIKPFNFPDAMPLYQRRVIIEKFDLDNKIEALAIFRHSSVFPGVDPDEQKRLTDQLQVMREYSFILAERILKFK